jgi:hypothetical protein
MSAYQFYEFLAVDRPLNDRQQAEVHSLSTRARITATSFVNEYHWGNFRGDPNRMMKRYYDAHLYLANWEHSGSCSAYRAACSTSTSPETIASATR